MKHILILYNYLSENFVRYKLYKFLVTMATAFVKQNGLIYG